MFYASLSLSLTLIHTFNHPHYTLTLSLTHSYTLTHSLTLDREAYEREHAFAKRMTKMDKNNGQFNDTVGRVLADEERKREALQVSVYTYVHVCVSGWM